MFQYAAARAISARNNLTLLLDRHTFFESDPFGRRYELGCFNISAPLLTRSEAKAALRRHYLRRTVDLLIERVAMRTLGHFFLPYLNTAAKYRNSYAENYFQSYLYFEESAQLIRREYEFQVEPTVKPDLAKAITESESVGVHVRFGHNLSRERSVVSSHVKRTREIMRGFYEKAFSLVLSSSERPRFFVFCDIAGSHEVFPQGAPVTVVPCNSSEPPWHDMWLMSLCKHNVIANSTYSWWAAWLNRNPDKRVYAPANFLCVHSRQRSKYVYPPSWTIL